MLESLEIKNYRNLNELKIDSLRRINLITGKNNTGKSALLEAISLYANKGDLSWIYQLLDERGENYKPEQNNKNPVETNIRTLSSLFTDRKEGYNLKDAISIGIIEDTLFGKARSFEKSISLRFVKYYDEIVYREDNVLKERIPIRRKRIIIEEPDIDNALDIHRGFEIGIGNGDSFIIPLEEERDLRLSYKNIIRNDNFQFIRTKNIEREVNGKLWDNIALTEKEEYVIEALRIIETNIEKITFIGQLSSQRRTTVVKLRNNSIVLPLKSMGDGINRILTIILALINSDNGFLLIDEFENGLHYSVQEELWKIIFKLAKKLKVQVFATTHSNDCINAFQTVLNDPENSENASQGKAIRLDFVNGQVKEVEFDAKELKIAIEQNIEIR